MRKLLSGILIITLCSCGTSFKALEQETTKSEKYSFRDYVVAVDSIWNSFSTRGIPISIALSDSLNKSPKRSKRNIIKYFDTIYAKEFSYEIEEWEQRPLEERLFEVQIFGNNPLLLTFLPLKRRPLEERKFEEVEVIGRYPLFGPKNPPSWKRAMSYAMVKAFFEIDDKYNYVIEEGKSIRKRRKQLKSNKEYMNGVNLADSIRGITLKKRAFSKKEIANTLRKYLDLRERYPLREQTDMFIYGYWFSRTVFIF